MTKLYYLISRKEGEEEENVERRREVEISLVCRGSQQKEYPQKKRKCNLLRKQRTMAKQANLSMMLYT
jgi:hypothetical protein